MTDPVRHNYEDHRAIFDSCLGFKHAHLGFRNSHMAVLPTKPDLPTSYHRGLKGPDREHWRQAAFSQYDKNRKIGLFSSPTPRENVPADKKVLPAVLAPKIKSHGDDLYEFVARLCANGAN